MGRPRVCRWLALSLLLALGGANACSDDSPTEGTGGSGGAGGLSGAGGRTGVGGAGGIAGAAGGTDGGNGGTSVPDGGAALSDAQIAAIMIEVNGSVVRAGQIANSRANSPATNAFATEMVADHLATTARLQMVLQAANINAVDSPERQILSSQGINLLDALWATPASTFDLFYLQTQISMTTGILRLLDTRLIPSAQNAALETELHAERADVMAQLTRAQQLLEALTTDAGAADASLDAPAGG